VDTTSFGARDPEVVEMLSKMTFKTDTMSALLAWMDENNASAEEAAVYFLSNNSDEWSRWLNDTATKRLANVLGS
jgi:glycine betaine/proline transport system substrate-binding protein